MTNLLTVLIDIIKRLGVVYGKDTEEPFTSSHILITHCTVNSQQFHNLVLTYVRFFNHKLIVDYLQDLIVD